MVQNKVFSRRITRKFAVNLLPVHATWIKYFYARKEYGTEYGIPSTGSLTENFNTTLTF